MYWDWREEIVGILGLISFIPFALAADLLNSRKFFRHCLAISITWFLLGMTFAYTNHFDLDTILVKGIFAFPAVHLLTFECLRRLFRKIAGKNPLITTFSSIRSGRSERGLFTKARTRRRLRFFDYAFTTLQTLIPFALLFGTWIFLSSHRRVPAPPIQIESAAHSPMVWFAPINDPDKPDWEILPQEAKAGEVILSKRNELGILSNFAATPFEMDGKRYASVEGFWQMMLYPRGLTMNGRRTNA